MDLVEAGYGDFAAVMAMPDLLRRTLWYGVMQRRGMLINWETGEVKPPKR